ncbi:hypothetical protein CROQUDRAFT_42796, partial [Cronartium quercuum f. sp. fusiforme G11]
LCMECRRCAACDEKGVDGNLLCDHCDRGWHAACLNPPLKTIPKGLSLLITTRLVSSRSS